ncbi:MAG: GYD domain-containing protein [Planctomycetota bacterium]
MTTLIALVKETQYGEENIYDTVVRAARFEELAKAFGATVKGLYWTLGAYDGVLVLDVPDSKTGAALLYRLTSGGSVRVEVLTAFNADEMTAILSRSQQVD